MCKLIIGVKLNNKKNEEFKNLIEAQRDTLHGEKDGICSLEVNTNNKVHVRRQFEYEKYDSVINDSLKSIKDKKIVSLHTRTGTCGEKSLLNVHYFDSDRYLMAHNGFVGKYYASEYSNSRKFGYDNNWGWSSQGGYHRRNEDIDSEIDKEGLAEDINPKNWCIECASLYLKDAYCPKHEGYVDPVVSNLPLIPTVNEKKDTEDSKFCDSARFMKSFKGEITKELLIKEIERTEFSGVANIYDKKLHKLWVFATRDIKIHTDSENYMLMYSFDPDTTVVKYTSFLGLPILDSEIDIDIEEKVVPAGVYCIDTDNLQVK